MPITKGRSRIPVPGATRRCGRGGRRGGQAGITSPVVLIYGLLLVLWIALAAEAAYQRQWISFAGYTVVALVFLVIPTGAMRRLGQSVPGRPQVTEHLDPAASDLDPPGSTTS